MRRFFFLYLLFQDSDQILQFLQQGFHLHDRDPVAFSDLAADLPKLLRILVILRDHYVRCIGLKSRADLADLGSLFFAPSGEFFHDIPVDLGSEEAPENDLLFIRAHAQQLHEFALRDHGHLHELVLGKAYDLFYPGIRLLPRPAVLRAVRQNQAHLLFGFCGTCPPL